MDERPAPKPRCHTCWNLVGCCSCGIDRAVADVAAEAGMAEYPSTFVDATSMAGAQLAAEAEAFLAAVSPLQEPGKDDL